MTYHRPSATAKLCTPFKVYFLWLTFISYMHKPPFNLCTYRSYFSLIMCRQQRRHCFHFGGGAVNHNGEWQRRWMDASPERQWGGGLHTFILRQANSLTSITERLKASVEYKAIQNNWSCCSNLWCQPHWGEWELLWVWTPECSPISDPPLGSETEP